MTGCQQILLRVQRTTDTGPSTAAQLFLFYSVYDQCQQQPVAFGWGVIPDAGFTVVTSGPLSSPQARATLRLTVPPNSQWFTSEGPTGTIDLTFTPTTARSARFSGTETTTDTSGTVTYRIAWSEVSATVDGHLLDAVIVAGEATLGSNKSRTRVQ